MNFDPQKITLLVEKADAADKGKRHVDTVQYGIQARGSSNLLAPCPKHFNLSVSLFPFDYCSALDRFNKPCNLNWNYLPVILSIP